MKYREMLLAEYAAQPGAMRDRLRGFANATMRESLEPGGWSPHQILAHVYAAEKHAFLPRVKRLYAEQGAQLRNWDETAWMEKRYDPSATVDSMLEGFAACREEGLALLREAEPAIWNRSGRHPSQGLRTLQWWVEYSVAHSAEHLAQLGGERR